MFNNINDKLKESKRQITKMEIKIIDYKNLRNYMIIEIINDNNKFIISEKLNYIKQFSKDKLVNKEIFSIPFQSNLTENYIRDIIIHVADDHKQSEYIWEKSQNYLIHIKNDINELKKIFDKV